MTDTQHTETRIGSTPAQRNLNVTYCPICNKVVPANQPCKANIEEK